MNGLGALSMAGPFAPIYGGNPGSPFQAEFASQSPLDSMLGGACMLGMLTELLELLELMLASGERSSPFSDSGGLFGGHGGLSGGSSGWPGTAAASGPSGAPASTAPGSNTPVGFIPSTSLVGSHGGQCVAFVQNQLGTHNNIPMAKDMLTPGVMKGYTLTHQPAPGEVFVMNGPDGTSQYGHTGFVKSVNADGTVTVIDSNWGENEMVHVHNIPIKDMAGFLYKSA